MSNYTSENTKVLATHVQDGNNKRMLLLHTMQNGSHEYVIGSYFTVVAKLPTEVVHDDGTVHDPMTGASEFGFASENAFRRFWSNAIKEYSWDWGHYFHSFLDAAHYWEREVLWREADMFTVRDEDGFLEGNILQVMRTNDGWSAHMYESDGTPTTYGVSGFDSKEELLHAFKRHRPTCELESNGKFER